MTDAEVWMEIAEHMRGSGRIPDCGEYGPSHGLCDALTDMTHCGLIDGVQCMRLKHALAARYYKVSLTDYYWPRGRTTDRIRACEQLALACLENER